jgi:glycosyltransferase involved in cell wall biosynthesis
MVVDGQTGLLVPPKSPEKLAAAMDQLLSHPELGRRMGEAGRRRCEEKFSLEAHVEAVVEQYEMVLAEQRAGSPAAVSV